VFEGFSYSLSDADRFRIITSALEASLRSKDYGPSELIREINKATRDFVCLPEDKYVVATSLSFKHFQDLTRIERSGCRLYVRRRLPRRFRRAHRKAKDRSKRLIRGDHPEQVPFKGYAAAWIHVRGRSVSEAMQRAVEELALRRGIWNFALNRRYGVPFPAPRNGPINEVLVGPLYVLHQPDGALAADFDWFDPQYTEPKPSRKLHQRWQEICKDEEGIRLCLKRSPYRAALEDALRRYCMALDTVDLSSSLLNLWSLLETLTGISPKDGHDKVVKRASFIFADEQRKTHEQVLHHLRRHRNSYVHAGEDSDQTGAYVHQLRLYVEQLLTFHLSSSLKFSSLDGVARFLDLPPDVSDIEHTIKKREQEAEAAAEAASLAREGLIFRKGG